MTMSSRAKELYRKMKKVKLTPEQIDEGLARLTHAERLAVARAFENHLESVLQQGKQRIEELEAGLTDLKQKVAALEGDLLQWRIACKELEEMAR